MDEMYARICNWENLRLAHQKAARGKRGKRAAAGFEYNLADNLLEGSARLNPRAERAKPPAGLGAPARRALLLQPDGFSLGLPLEINRRSAEPPR
jgi:hypothetical protein